jgi:hypothetical protein
MSTSIKPSKHTNVLTAGCSTTSLTLFPSHFPLGTLEWLHHVHDQHVSRSLAVTWSNPCKQFLSSLIVGNSRSYLNIGRARCFRRGAREYRCRSAWMKRKFRLECEVSVMSVTVLVHYIMTLIPNSHIDLEPAWRPQYIACCSLRVLPIKSRGLTAWLWLFIC